MIHEIKHRCENCENDYDEKNKDPILWAFDFCETGPCPGSLSPSAATGLQGFEYVSHLS